MNGLAGSLGVGLMILGAVLLRRRRVAGAPPHRREAAMLPGGTPPVVGFQSIVECTSSAARIDAIRIKLGFPAELFERAGHPVIEAYGEFVQLLPASESHQHADRRGLFTYCIEVASLALDYRRGQILPPGAAPEAIGEQAHRWTYAVFVAGLLRGVRSAAKSERDESTAVQLLSRFVPPAILEWLAMDDVLTHELNAFLSGDETAQTGAIGGLVQRAEVEAMRRNAMSARARGCTQRLPPTDTHLPATAMKYEGERATPVPDKGSAEDANGHASVLSDQRTPELVPSHFIGPVITETEYLEDIETKDGVPTSESPESHPSREPAPLMRAPVFLSKAVLPGVLAIDEAASDAARRFMGWLQQGLADGSVRVNEPGALVHFVDAGMLLVSPRIFKEFAKRFGEDGRGSAVIAAGHDIDPGRSIQRQVLRAGWHVQAEKGINILTYQETRGGRAVSQLCGVLIRNPHRFVNPVPPANPVLMRLPGKPTGT